MRRYETIFIVDSDLSDEDRDPIFQRLKDLIQQFSGFLAMIDEWGAKRLAYEIKKKARGYYVRIDYCGDGALVSEIERFFRIDERILKYMTVLLNKDADIDQIKEEVAQAEAEAKAKAEARAKADADAEARAEAKAKAQAEAEAKAEIETKAEVEQPQSDDESTPKEAETESKAEAEAPLSDQEPEEPVQEPVEPMVASTTDQIEETNPDTASEGMEISPSDTIEEQ